ncbi:MAG: DUF1294 domain-containing protein [Patescibacteria group bacterium]
MGNNQELLIWMFLISNVFSFVLVGIDKRKSFNRAEQRVPEAWFFFLATLFASLGVFLGIFAFRHKTRKFYLPLGIGLLLLEQSILVYLLFFRN